MSDAEATEGSDASLDFLVTLTRAYSRTATVDYATSNGTATAGLDYTAVSSRVVFRAGETSKTISVAIRNDEVSEPDGETVKLTLSNTAHAEIIDGDAVGTIRDGAVTDTVETSEESDEFTAEFKQVPASHDGEGRFTVRVKFSEELANGSGRKLRRALSVSGGSSKSVRRVGDARDLYVVAFEPTGDNSVTISLGPSAVDCTARDAICTADDTPLTGTISATIGGPSTEAARANQTATGRPIITGTTQVGETLTAVTTAISDADGLTDVSYSYQWIRNNGTDDADISGATSGIYTLVDADQSKTIKVEVSFTDDAGHSEELTSAATSTVAAGNNNAAKGAPTISGTAQVGQTLTASTTGISDDDGLTNVSYSYQWLRNNGTDYAEISGATRSTFIPARVDQGKTLKVRVPFTDDAGHSEELTSAATGPVAARPNRAASGSPTITGTAQVGQTLTASTSAIADDDGLAKASYSYQWIRNDGTDDSDISGATSGTYTLVGADQGNTIKVKVSFTDDVGNDEELTSVATSTVAAADNNAATGAPTISGTAQVGQTLTASTSRISDDDGLTDASYEYQWIRNDGTNDSEISAATSSTYTLADGDEGKTIKVKVSFTDNAGHSEELTSAATASVAARPNRAATGAPTISGTAKVGETLTADTSGIADADGLEDVSYSYQWIRNNGADDSEISGATSSTYTLADEDEGKTIKVRVSFTDDAGNDEELTSASTETVAPPPFTAEFLAIPTSHDGSARFTFRLKFSEEIKQGTKRNLWRTLTRTGADMKEVLRVNNRLDLFEFTFEPTGDEDVTMSLGPSTTDCTARDAICTADDEPLTGTITATISGPSG